MHAVTALAFALLSALPARQGAGAAIAAERCADCHEAIVLSYTQSGMARALRPLVPGELAGLEPVAAGAAGYRYHFEESLQPSDDDPEQAWIVETWQPAKGSGQEPVRSSARIAYAVGAGILDRSYVVERHGMSWFAPLEMLSASAEGPRRAALAPGHVVSPGLRFDNPITEECLACHTDSLPPRGYPLNLAPPESARWSPRGISCGACHASALEHASWRERELSGERPAGTDPLVAERPSDVVERLSVCARCHLQGDARIALRSGERGIPPPGADLLDLLAVFVPAQRDDAVAFVSQVERMVDSRCYLGSLDRPGRELSCGSCHDPHVSTHDPRESRRVRDGCFACHEPLLSNAEKSACSLERDQRGEQDCVDCHMPRTGVFDVAHVEIHDHLIARSPGNPARPAGVRIQHTTDGRLRAFSWPGRNAPAYASDPGLALMAALIARFPEQAARFIDERASTAVRALPTYQHLRGVLLEQLGRDADARAAYREALRLDPGQSESAVNLALLLGRLRAPAEGIRQVDGVLERHPRAEGALRNRALLRYALGDGAGFAADLEAAQSILPLSAVARSLASWYEQRGDLARAGSWREEARRLAPHEP